MGEWMDGQEDEGALRLVSHCWLLTVISGVQAPLGGPQSGSGKHTSGRGSALATVHRTPSLSAKRVFPKSSLIRRLFLVHIQNAS